MILFSSITELCFCVGLLCLSPARCVEFSKTGKNFNTFLRRLTIYIVFVGTCNLFSGLCSKNSSLPRIIFRTTFFKYSIKYTIL